MIMKKEVEPSALLEAALSYARLGWRVFPVFEPVFQGETITCSCRNPACGSIGKHPRLKQGFKGAAVDESIINDWWRACPQANIGIATGKDSHLLVIDVDGPEGEKALKTLQEAHGDLPSTLQAKTGKGFHLYFQLPEGIEISCSAGKLGTHIDVRGEGGYVVAPPSLHSMGTNYMWVNAGHPPAALSCEWINLLSTLKFHVGDPNEKGEKIPIVEIAEETFGEGTRNDNLFRTACSLVRKGSPKRTVLESIKAMNEAVCTPPLDEGEVDRIVESAWSYKAVNMTEKNSERQIRLGLSDKGNAERLEALYGDRLLWNTDEERFMIYDGQVWNRDSGTIAENMALKVVERLAAEGESLNDPKDRALMNDFALKCQTPTRIKAALEIYQMNTEKNTRLDDFERHPHLLNCANGIVDLRSGNLLPHDPSLKLLSLAPVEYHRDAKSPLWEKFLSEVFLNNADAINSFKRQIGYLVTGEMKEQKFFLWLGNGRNGKSTIRNILSGVLGDYIGDTSSSAFTAKRYNSESYELADQVKKRMIFSAETTNAFQLDEPLIKAISGGDRCTFRAIYQEPITTYPTFKIVIPCNRMPEIKGTDDGIWDRCHFLHFKRKFEGKERVQDYHKVLLTEKEGIFAWMVESAMEWYKGGLSVSEESKEMNSMFRSASDALGQFLEEECEIGYGHEAGATNLYERYTRWCEAKREIPTSSNKFGTELTLRQIQGVERHKTRTGVVYRGIRLKLDPLLRQFDTDPNFSPEPATPPSHKKEEEQREGRDPLLAQLL
ncbi:MAG: phage/plasmid primase, P4 family [Synergistales bacterium]